MLTQGGMTVRCSLAPHLLFSAALLACVAEPPTPTGQAEDPGALAEESLAASTAGYRVEIVRTLPFVLDARRWTIKLARIHRPDGGRTYVQWIPADKPGPRPTVVTTGPYQLVSWTGEALDARWATYQPLANGLYLDRDGPGFDGRAAIVAERKTPLEVAEESVPHLLNDFGSLTIFGRFYAGGSVRDDIADMAAGMWFVANQPEVDRARIGIWGGSWGGFLALYAAQQADVGARPAVVSAMFPPSDFAALVGHVQSRTGAAAQMLQPYLRRVYAATGGPPTQAGTNYRGLRATDLCATLPQTLVLHDEHDNLIPVQQTQALAASCQVETLVWPRTGPIDTSVWTHGPLLDGPGPHAVALYSLTYLHLRMMRPDQPYLLEFYAPASLRTQLQELHDAQLAGRDVAHAVPRLYDLIDARVYLVDLSTCTSAGCSYERGYDVVGRMINEIWGPSSGAAAASSLPAGLSLEAQR